MKDELENLCEERLYARIDYCAEYGTKNCPSTCYYAKQITEQINNSHNILVKLNVIAHGAITK